MEMSDDESSVDTKVSRTLGPAADYYCVIVVFDLIVLRQFGTTCRPTGCSTVTVRGMPRSLIWIRVC